MSIPKYILENNTFMLVRDALYINCYRTEPYKCHYNYLIFL